MLVKSLGVGAANSSFRIEQEKEYVEIYFI